MLSNSDRKIINDTNLFPAVYLYEPTIASGADTSEGIAARGASVIGIKFPASMTGASMTVEFSFNETDWFPISGLTMSIDAGEGYNIEPPIAGWPFVRFVSDSNEAAERTLSIIVKHI
jgi:hypothetical protein